jgi:hypothetical protein
MISFLTVLYGCQSFFSLYNLSLCIISITKLRGYEETSKKAAQYSQTAADELQKTRTTQASALLAVRCPLKLPKISILINIHQVLFSLLSAGVLVFKGDQAWLMKFALAGANVLALESARRYVGSQWKGRAKMPLPGMADFNEATTKTQEVRMNMAALALSWIGIGAVSLVL